MKAKLLFHGKPIGGAPPPKISWEERERQWATNRAAAQGSAVAPTDPKAENHLAPNGAESGHLILQRTPEWFAQRLGKITASIAGACLGLNPYMGRAKAWRVIKGMEPDVLNVHKERGVAKEEPARRLYEARHGIRVDLVGFVVHERLSWLGASPDGLVGHTGLLEIKCPVRLPEEVPPYHVIQCRVQLACTGRQWCDYFSWNGKDIFEKRIVRDVHIEHAMLMSLWQFYCQYVQTNTQPPKTYRLKINDPWIR